MLIFLRSFLLSLAFLTGATGCVTPTGSAPIRTSPQPGLEATAPPETAERRPAPTILATARLAAVGDLLMHETVKNSAAAANQKGPDGGSLNHEGYDALFEGVADALREADLVFANLETPIAPTTNKGSRPFVFNAPPALLPALQGIGVGLVSFANNHVYDQGLAGFLETLDVLEAAGLPQVGAGKTCPEAEKAKILEVQGIRIAFIGATRLFNENENRGRNHPCAFLLDETIALREAKAAREAGAELVVLSAHWGIEYSTAPREQEVALAHRLLDGGFDAILGHHPHVLQPLEVYETQDGRLTFVAYSLGNFISNQSRTFVQGVHPDKMGNPRDGVILRFSAVRKDYGGEIRTEWADLVAEPVWTENNALARQRDKKLAPRVRVIHVDRRLDALREEVGAVSGEESLPLQKEIEALESRRQQAGRILGEDFLP